MMKLLEDLKLKFPMKEVPPYGFCIVVPGAEFNPDWEAELGDKGYKCFDTDLDGKRVTLVRVVKGEKGSGEKVVYSPPPTAQSDNVTKSPGEQAGLKRVLKGKDTPLGPRWTEDKYKLLIKLWNERKKTREIAAKFPDRSGHAVAAALGRLQQSGAIKPRWTQKKNRFSKVGPEPAAPQPSVDKSADTPVHTPVTLDKLASDVKGILDVLDVQSRVLDKLFCALLMQAVEVKQEKGDLSIPPSLWIHYANALLEEDKQYREKFRLKVQQLLEASS